MGVNRTELDQDTTKRRDQRKAKEAMEDVGGFYLGSRLRRAASDNGHPASDERATEREPRAHARVDGGMWWVQPLCRWWGCEIRKSKVHEGQAKQGS